MTPGVYEWTCGAGADQNFTLDIGASPVPEPSTWAMIADRFRRPPAMRAQRDLRKSAALAA